MSGKESVNQIEQKYQVLKDQNKYLQDGIENMRKHYQVLLRLIGHDLMNPLEKVEALLKEDYSPQRWMRDKNSTPMRSLLERINHALVDLKHICFSERISAFELNQKNTLGVQQILDALSKRFEFDLRTKSLQLVPKIKSENWCVLTQVDLLLNHVLNNLVANAIKFSPSGAQIDIEFDRSTDGKMKMSIRDYGIGIPNWQVQRILSGLKSESRLGTEGEKGNGLGLKLTYEVMVQLGLDFNIKSYPIDLHDIGFAGTEMTIVFPRGDLQPIH